MNEHTERMSPRPSPFSTIDSASAAAAVQPHRRIGARITKDQRVHKDEPWHDYQWRRTLDDIEESLLERTCEAAMEACEGGVAGMIDTLVRSAAEANAAEQARAQATTETAKLQAEIAQRQSVIDGLQADLVVERDRLKYMRKQLDREMAARAQRESERDDARRECQRVLSVAESEMERLRGESDAQKAELTLAWQQLDAVMAERSKLVATVRCVQSALSGTWGELDVEAAGPNLVRPGPRQQVRIEKSSNIGPALAALASAPVRETPVAAVEAHPEAVEDIKQVLERVKAVYDLDVNAGRFSAELVESLTIRLREARDAIIARSILPERGAIALFEQQIDIMLDSTVDTSFARHLSIAAYAALEPVTSTQGESGTERQTVASASLSQSVARSQKSCC
jgi:hypothetical protein